MKKAIIIGATSGIGRELAKILSQNDYVVGIAGRREELLCELQKEITAKTYAKRIDVAQASTAMNSLKELINDMGGMDLLVISAGTGYINPEVDWEKEKETIDVNVSGFAAMANVGIRHFCQEGSGHLVGISSIAALRGSGEAPSYNASKAFISNYLEGIRKKTAKLKLPITVTDIQPGFVDTAMAKGEGLFWVATPAKAASQIFRAIKRKRKHAYITKRWRIIAWMLKIMPDWIYNRL
ncbi:MAG: SDR family NAD(P)-dependent oxidoreductase [Planctomycetes bacterium]|nr:SDR family NAD(P)-dependent oxidoreductase [Planctomycetota bacterium]